MHRTQLYLEDSTYSLLKKISQEQKTSISELLRLALDQVYKPKRPKDFKRALASSLGIWAKRRDIPDTQTYVRSLRQGRRAKRLGLL